MMVMTDIWVTKYIYPHLHNGKSLGPLMDLSYVI